MNFFFSLLFNMSFLNCFVLLFVLPLLIRAELNEEEDTYQAADQPTNFAVEVNSIFVFRIRTNLIIF